MMSRDVDVLDDHVVAEDRVAVRAGRARLRELLEVDLGTFFGLLGFVMSRMSMSSSSEVVDEHDVDLAGLLPGPLPQANAECVWLAFVCGTPLAAPRAFRVKSPAPSTSFFGLARVGHVDERDAADAVRRPGAPLVLVHEQVALERRRVERDDL